MQKKTQHRLLGFAIALAALILFFRATASVQGQIPGISVDDLLDRAVENARRYTDLMRNLTADETRRTEIFDKNGNKTERVTVSDFIVHTTAENTLAEFRRVRRVDGKILRGGDRRLEEFLQELSHSNSESTELELVDRESSRYDLGNMRMRGMALNQAWPLEESSFREKANFQVEGREHVLGHETWVVRYEAPSQIPDSLREFLDVIEPTRTVVRGRVWIDVDSAAIWKYETETLVAGKSLPNPALWDRMVFEYQSSLPEIVTPLRIVWSSFSLISRDRSGFKLALKGRVTTSYGDFRRFGAEVQIVPFTPH